MGGGCNLLIKVVLENSLYFKGMLFDLRQVV